MEIPNPDSQSLPPGAQLEEFLIERVLGSGGFGITYLARDTSLGRQVVIKENLPSQFAWRETATGTVRPRHSTGGDADDYEWSMRNFLKEAETLASLDHPGIVRVLRKFETNGTAYFVMPFVEGFAFDTLIDSRSAKGQAFSEEELGGLIHRMLSALGYLHERGIYHRDIKPANILITMEGVPVLIDFGSARQRLSERSMTVIESAGYTPFEQLQSRGNVGPWSDLYALGGTLVKALTGEAPPKANDRVRKDPYQPLAERVELRSQFTWEFLHGIDKSLAVDEENRWQNAKEWLAAMQNEVPAETVPPEPTRRAEPPPLPETPRRKEPPQTVESPPPLPGGSPAPIPSSTFSASAGQSLTKSSDGPTGVGGWLVFFCVSLTILGPLLLLGQMVNGWEQAEPAFSRFPTIKSAIISENLGWSAIIIYGFIVGRMIRSGNLQGRKIARRFLLIRLFGFIGVEIIALLIISDLPSEVVSAVIKSAVEALFYEGVYFTVWWLYLKKSKRVRNIYGYE